MSGWVLLFCMWGARVACSMWSQIGFCLGSFEVLIFSENAYNWLWFILFFAVWIVGPVAQLGWSVRLITERSRVQISPGPPRILSTHFCVRQKGLYWLPEIPGAIEH